MLGRPSIKVLVSTSQLAVRTEHPDAAAGICRFTGHWPINREVYFEFANWKLIDPNCSMIFCNFIIVLG